MQIKRVFFDTFGASTFIILAALGTYLFFVEIPIVPQMLDEGVQSPIMKSRSFGTHSVSSITQVGLFAASLFLWWPLIYKMQDNIIYLYTFPQQLWFWVGIEPPSATSLDDFD